LEWDIVFLPALDRKTHGDDKQLLYWRSRRIAGRELLLLGPMESTIGAPASGASIESYLRGISSQCAEEELKRLFYVAATRARRRLYLSATVSKEKQPASGSILRLLWSVPELQQAFAPPAAVDAVASVAAPAPKPAELLLRRLPAAYIAPDAPAALPWKVPPPAAADVQHSFQWAGELARLIGVVTHGFLERIANEGLERWDDARIIASRPAVAAWLLRGGATRAALDEGCTLVLRALRQTLADPRGRWLLSSHPEHACELALSAVVEGRLEHIRVDRTFVEDGTRWLIDYKTSPQEGGDLSRWVTMQVDKYRPDMQRYVRVVRAWDPRPIRCALYLPLLGVFREVEIASIARAEG
jgi:ATP-dependent exoDNAse (exonuclease V) beta subunit